MVNRRWRIVLLLLVVAGGIPLGLRRGEEVAAPPPVPAVVGAHSESTGTPIGQEAKAKSGLAAGSEDIQRSSPLQPVKERPPEEIRKSLEAKAREMMEKGLGGVTEEDKQALTAAIHEFETLRARGLSDRHPGMLVSLATFSRKIDRLSAYDEAEWKADAASFLRKRLSEVEALGDGESVAALRERWEREQARDDLPEAILLRSVRPFGPAAGMKEGLRDELKKWIETFDADAK